jgi:hypothetical protein
MGMSVKERPKASLSPKAAAKIVADTAKPQQTGAKLVV